MTKIGVVGAGGRMGRMLLDQILQTEGVALSGAVERAGSALLGQDAGTLAGRPEAGIFVTEDPYDLFAEADAVVDFTAPQSTADLSALAAQARTAHIIGTTGLDSTQEETVRKAARHTAVVLAPNMSVGVNLLLNLVERVAAALDDRFDIEIVESHHRHKADAPSGTALALGRAAAAGRRVDLDAAAVRGRDGITGARLPGGIGFAVVRGGDIVGEHTVMFAGEAERIELSHRATDRAVFARGAVDAARWAHGKPPGLYSMRDVLGL